MADASYAVDLIVTQSFTATGSVSILVSGYQSVGFAVTGTWVGTVFFEGSMDGAVWYGIEATAPDTLAQTNNTIINGNWIVQCGGSQSIRARVGAYTSGTINIQLLGSAGNQQQNIAISTLPLQPSRDGGSASLTANGQSGGVLTNGCSTAVFQISGTWVGTFQFQGTAEDGTTFVPLKAIRLDTNPVFGRDVQTTTTTNGTFEVNCGGLTQVLCKFIAFTSGTAIVTAEAGVGTGIVIPHINRGRNLKCAGMVGGWRVVGNNGTPQYLMAIQNNSTAGIQVAVREVSVGVDSSTAQTGLFHFRVMRATAISGGSALTKLLLDTSTSSDANVTILNGASADGTNSTISATPGTMLWQAFGPHPNTIAAWANPSAIRLLPDEVKTDPLILRTGEALVVQANWQVGANNVNTIHYLTSAMWDEFTYP
jgi:hypothetical protein